LNTRKGIMFSQANFFTLDQPAKLSEIEIELRKRKLRLAGEWLVGRFLVRQELGCSPNYPRITKIMQYPEHKEDIELLESDVTIPAGTIIPTAPICAHTRFRW